MQHRVTLGAHKPLTLCGTESLGMRNSCLTYALIPQAPARRDAFTECPLRSPRRRRRMVSGWEDWLTF
jgi:hypothetical protein